MLILKGLFFLFKRHQNIALQLNTLYHIYYSMRMDYGVTYHYIISAYEVIGSEFDTNSAVRTISIPSKTKCGVEFRHPTRSVSFFRKAGKSRVSCYFFMSNKM